MVRRDVLSSQYTVYFSNTRGSVCLMTSTALSVPVQASFTLDPWLFVLPLVALGLLAAGGLCLVATFRRSRYDSVALTVPVVGGVALAAGVLVGVVALNRIADAVPPLSAGGVLILVVFGLIYFGRSRNHVGR